MQGRYTWRQLVSSIRDQIDSSSELYADLPNLRASDSPPATIPSNISTTSSRPDLALIEDSTVSLLELTVPTNINDGLSAAKHRKFNKASYLQLISDLHGRQKSCGSLPDIGN